MLLRFYAEILLTSPHKKHNAPITASVNGNALHTSTDTDAK